MTDQQAAAFRQLSTIELVGYAVGSKALLVRVTGRLFRLSAGGLLYPISTRRSA